MSRIHRYPTHTIYADYLRAGAGLALTLGPLVFLDVLRWLAIVLGLLGALFAWFAVRTWLRHRSTLAISDQGIEILGPTRRRIAWSDLAQLRLRYFAPRGNRERGWFELMLKGVSGVRLKIDSTLEAFDDLLARVLAAARARDVPLDETTLANLKALGLLQEAGGEDHRPG